MKDKYIDEKFGYWFVFGEGPNGVDITSSDQQMDTGPVPKSVAEILIREHNRVQDQLRALAQAFDRASPSAFSAFWYGQPTATTKDAMDESPALCELAWTIYCEETAGDMHVVDSWEALPVQVKEKYFKEAMTAPYGAPRRNRTSTP